jgi:hypothetical protein
MVESTEESPPSKLACCENNAMHVSHKAHIELFTTIFYCTCQPPVPL